MCAFIPQNLTISIYITSDSLEHYIPVVNSLTDDEYSGPVGESSQSRYVSYFCFFIKYYFKKFLGIVPKLVYIILLFYLLIKKKKNFYVTGRKK